MKSTKQVAHGEGFYDYAGDSPELENLESADASFLELENGFSQVREKLITDRFRNWKRHRRFLFKFMQMLRARSPLFFEQKQAEGKALETWTVKEVQGNKITLDSMEPKPPSDAFIKNRTILHMREEIKNGADWLWDFHWALRYCDSVNSPFVMTEAPFLAVGDRPGQIGQMLRDPETVLFFPICWQACLFGSRRRFDKETDKFGMKDMSTFRKKYRSYANVFLVSPTKLEDISATNSQSPSSTIGT